MPSSVAYVHLAPGAVPPALHAKPFRAIVIAEQSVAPDWQSQVSAWLVRAGCLYMMAWGTDCTLWDDSVDMANLEMFGFADIPDDQFVMTTWHENEPISEMFWFAKNAAFHPTIELKQVLIVHIAQHPAKESLLRAYDEA